MLRHHSGSLVCEHDPLDACFSHEEVMCWLPIIRKPRLLQLAATVTGLVVTGKLQTFDTHFA